MESSVLTLRVSAKTKSQLEKLAAATNRSKSFLAAEALERYIELDRALGSDSEGREEC